MKKLSVIIIAILAFPGIFSCKSLPSVVLEPKLSIKTVELAGISFKGVDMIFHVDVENPNNIDLPFPKIDWEFFINSVSFAQGSLSKGVTIKKRKTVTVPVALSLSYEALYKSFSSLIENKEASYEFKAGVTFPHPSFQDTTYNLEYSGNIPLVQLPRFSPGSLRIAKIDFLSVELAYGFNIENPNVFAIPVPKLEWEYAAAGIALFKSSLQSEGELAPKTSSPMEITFSINYADLIKAAPSLVNAGEAPSLLKINSGFPFPSLNEEVKNVFDIAGSLPILKMPEISVKGINIKELGLLKFEFVVNWEIDNKNAFFMDISEFNYEFKVNGDLWAKGLFQNPPQIKANSKTTLPLTVVIDTFAMISSLKDIIQKGTGVEYSCTGNMSLTSNFPGLKKIDIPVNLSGSSRLLH
ncbi:MAG: LEA type 2 family protein [Treponema sp.]|jgi:LEA14-like dessication related protein|nr:LEA type 2 family protein [Treponema sp.]